MARLLVGISLVVVFAFAILQPAFTIGEWEQGMILQFGQWQRTLRDPGLYFKIPFMQQLIRFDKRVLTMSRAGGLSSRSSSTAACGIQSRPGPALTQLSRPVCARRSPSTIFWT